MKRKAPIKKILLSLYHYFCFFLVMAFVISCCMSLFVSTMSRSMGITLTNEMIERASKLTFWNVVFLSFVCTLIDGIRRKFMVDRPVQKIVSAAEQIAKGDYSVRIPPLKGALEHDGLDEIVDSVNKMAEELSGVETLQTDFVANVSHELKTPIAVIQNYATLLQHPELSEEDRLKYAKSIGEATRRLSGLVTNILKLNKLESQQIYPQAQNYNLTSQICECLLAFEHVWEEKGIDIETDMAEDIFITADPELLSLVWNNLLSNAFKFTDEGGKVGVTLRKKGNTISVSVADTGCGISPEVGRHIFDKFYQGDTSHATQGNGLGLALVKRVVNIMGGDIAVSSEVGKGSTFTVTLRGTGNADLEENR